MKKGILFTVAVLAGLAFSGIAAAMGFDAGSSASLGLIGVGMAANYIQEGDVLTLTAPYTVTSGQGAQVGSQFAVALKDITNATEGEFATSGVWSLAKTSAQAWTVGQKIYWDNSNKRCDSDGTVGILIGVATAVAANPSSTGNVKLNEAVAATSEGPQAAEADLTGTLTGTANGSLADIAATAGACAGDATPTATQVDTAIATAVASIVTGVNEQNKELLTKINALLAKLRIAGIIAP